VLSGPSSSTNLVLTPYILPSIWNSGLARSVSIWNCRDFPSLKNWFSELLPAGIDSVDVYGQIVWIPRQYCVIYNFTISHGCSNLPLKIGCGKLSANTIYKQYFHNRSLVQQLIFNCNFYLPCESPSQLILPWNHLWPERLLAPGDYHENKRSNSIYTRNSRNGPKAYC